MIEPGSFRDPTSRVFYDGDRVLRGLSSDTAEIDASVRTGGLMATLVSEGMFVDNWTVDDVLPPAGVPSATVVESARIPLVSYPSEWSFSMLRDAALTTLDANLLCLEQGFILKDASAFNVLFRGVTPVIVDVTSVDVFGEEGTWAAYGQFCDHFLAPLMFEAFCGIPFRRVLHSQTDGLPIEDLNRLLRGRSALHRGVLSHVRLRSYLEGRSAGMDTDKRRDVAKVVLPKAAVARTIRKMRKLVSSLESSAPSTWADYEAALPYEEVSSQAKAEFATSAAVATKSHSLAVDVGANVGRFTMILTEHFDSVVGLDSDSGTVDALYTLLATSDTKNLTPLVVDITNPTPSFGWRGVERSAFTERVQPDFTMWLAVMHHLCLGIGIPLEQMVAQIFGFSREAVVEFVSRDDPMAQRISASRTTALAPYSRDLFEEYVSSHGRIVERHELTTTRTLYHVATS